MKIPVFYRPEMNANAGSFSKSPSKPKLVVEDWLARFPIEVVSFTPARKEHIRAAHDPDYVDGVLNCKVPNGFGNMSKAVAESLPYTVGSMVAAAKYVMTAPDRDHRSAVAVSPTSGFHHACYDHGGGYCTFNGLIVAAMVLKRLKLVKKVGILDMDHHYGDGTDDIIRRLGLDWIVNKTHDSPEDVSSKHLMDLRYKDRVDVVFAHMGADVHVNDPLGGRLTTEEMKERDRTVMFVASAYNIPLVWNLAGGYQTDVNGTIQPVIDLHRETMAQCVKHYVEGV